MFIIELIYKAPLEEIDAYMKQHVQFLNKYYQSNKFIVSGRKIPRDGGIIIATASTKKEIEKIIKQDPFHKHKLADFRIIEFNASQKANNKKKFKEFFLEFVMIFLAVTLGFIAENVRESISNHEQEKHYAESLINNLKEDTVYMNMAIKENIVKKDSLERLLHLASADFSKGESRMKLYNYCVHQVGYYALFKANDATMNQLKNTGLQFIKKDHVADSIASFDVRLKIIYAAEDIYTKATNEALEAAQQLLDLSVSEDSTYFDTSTGFKNVMLPLYEDNQSSLPRFFNKIDFESGATQNYINNIQRILPYTERLIAYLKKEYDLE